ncbi:MAG: SNF2 helicase associated domain-containing protein [Oscillospiraceae bacterium]|nr:SNF2 helicase associated domain-containing protein [Oscillospiraceae bacterium]
MEFHKENKAWQDLFPSDLLEKAEKIVSKKQVEDLTFDESHASAWVITGPASSYRVQIRSAPESYYNDWDPNAFFCDCIAKRSMRKTTGASKTMRYSVCHHEAAVLLAWERAHGKWFFEAPPEWKAEVERRAREEDEARERECRVRAEAARLKLMRDTDSKVPAKAVDVFPDDGPDGTYFDVRTAAQHAQTNLFAVKRAKELLGAPFSMNEPDLCYGADGEQMLCCSGRFDLGREHASAEIDLLPGKIAQHRCSCNPYYTYYSRQNRELCEHELLLMLALRQYVLKENPGDATDAAAEAFLRAAGEESAVREAQAEAAPKERDLVLVPRIAADRDEVALTFRAGFAGGRQYAVRNVGDLVKAYVSEGQLSLGKSAVIDFALSDFSEDSSRWMEFLRFRVGESEAARRALPGWYSFSQLSVKSRDVLVGATLDRFYDTAEDDSLELQTASAAETVRIGHAPVRVVLESSRVQDSQGRFCGVLVTGKMPRILNGSTGKYFLGNGFLSRLDKEDERALIPFRKAANASGDIRFRIGMGNLSEFYYRVVPRMLEKSFVDFRDGCGSEVEKLLPPEPEFTFYLDVSERTITCRTAVSYGGGELTIPCAHTDRAADSAQESRVLNEVSAVFPQYGRETQLFTLPYSEDNMFTVMTEGVARLERYGTVKGSEAFNRNRVRPIPQVKLGVSLQSDLLDVSILTTDMTQAELLAVLKSYRMKKRYYRLSSGAFVDLMRSSEQLAEVDSIMDRLGVEPDEAVLGAVHAPAYRALWLDRLLEEHEELAAQRDRTFQALVKNFKTIRDADYEVPAAQAGVLRTYQVFGYKWLRTLTAAGFGGILADEMGIGKTIQTIALLQSLHDGGASGASLVVCPSSLVYNWQEKFRRFAPGLDVRVVAGTPAARKKLLDGLNGSGFTVCVTSYDLLRQDFLHYAEHRFHTMVLDEAQYVKNQKAAVTRAVKSVKAEHRFALTGTPIENRLAELWSIFDFIMPGFLYGYAEFSRRFEAPITKHRDDGAAARLRQMTGPFILRRLKKDVLRDLPPKLEEVRYTRFEAEQRKVYDHEKRFT